MLLSFRFSLSILFLLHVFSAHANSHWTVNSLPGFSGELPFSLETGYVGVGDWEEFQLFYYFIKSYSNPKTDPLVLWLTGGPGCSALSGLAFESGPINFEGELKEGSLPRVLINPYSWTQNTSILYLDLPVGTGFSYAKTSKDHISGDHEQVQHSLQFLKKWFDDHPEFISNPFYISGNSYSGMIVPMVALAILEGTYKHIFSFINFQGYILGNPITIPHANENCQIPFAHNMALISDELYQSLEASCQGEYVNIDPNNVECLKHYDTFTKCTSVVRDSCILWSKCSSLKEPQTKSGQRRSLINSIFVGQRCREHDAILAYYWANNDEVQKALHIHEGSIGEWIRCRGKEYYNFELTSVFPYHVNLSSKGYRSLIYSGDHDMVVPHIETHAWIKALNYSIVDDWRPWFIEDEVGGYTRSFANNMTFVTVKGGGHTPEYLREESSIVFKRWIVGEWL
uniref:Serine carboxypeptidase n=1 Tax=Cucumis sativus TaxID=3659 RepID=A0A0A0L2L9_CUCSA